MNNVEAASRPLWENRRFQLSLQQVFGGIQVQP
jgi:hypothetical protein